ncbi:MAG: NAD(P)H-hydrate dehydratase, partial [Planctomycetes bacterium]|nr:NAD(P)H-hydrate dehydratase [Planctomycetota bacterium]
VTVTFHGRKVGLAVAPGLFHAGEVVVADIGLDPLETEHRLVTPEILSLVPRKRPEDSKYTAGAVLVAGGAPGMTGAACLAASAALRSGAGLVTVAIGERSWPIVATKLTEAMTRPLPEAADGCPEGESFSALLSGSTRFDAILLGPGMGRGGGPARVVRTAVREARVPLVIDADALFCLAQDAGLLAALPRDAILTPHPGEFARLIGAKASDVQTDREGLASGFARRRGGILVLKGRGTVVADGERTWINPTGNPGMATGGSGDVLAGMIASFRAQGSDAFEAARLGVYLHGLAGDIAARAIGETALIASDIVESIPAATRAHAVEDGGWPSARC